MDAPDVRYAKSGDVNIAYSVVGDGPFDLIFVVGSVFTALEYAWEGPPGEFFSKLASFSRLIVFDKRGTGRVALESLGDLLRACGQNPTLAEIRDLEKQAGGDCDRRVYF